MHSGKSLSTYKKKERLQMNDIIQYKGYYAEIHFNAEDEVFYGKLIGINDLVNFEADSVKELKKAFNGAVEDYLKTCKEIGKVPDKTYKGSFNVRIPSELHRQAAILAAIKKVTLNDFVRYALDLTISKEKDNSELANKRITAH
jgi:predicted HicB family RNase H-like nuclease